MYWVLQDRWEINKPSKFCWVWKLLLLIWNWRRRRKWYVCREIFRRNKNEITNIGQDIFGEIIFMIHKMCYKNTHVHNKHTYKHRLFLSLSHLHKSLVGWFIGCSRISHKNVGSGRASVTNPPAPTACSSLQHSPIHVQAYGKPLFPSSEEHTVHWVSPGL